MGVTFGGPEAFELRGELLAQGAELLVRTRATFQGVKLLEQGHDFGGGLLRFCRGRPYVLHGGLEFRLSDGGVAVKRFERR